MKSWLVEEALRLGGRLVPEEEASYIRKHSQIIVLTGKTGPKESYQEKIFRDVLQRFKEHKLGWDTLHVIGRGLGLKDGEINAAIHK